VALYSRERCLKGCSVNKCLIPIDCYGEDTYTIPRFLSALAKEFGSQRDARISLCSPYCSPSCLQPCIIQHLLPTEALLKILCVRSYFFFSIGTSNFSQKNPVPILTCSLSRYLLLYLPSQPETHNNLIIFILRRSAENDQNDCSHYQQSTEPYLPFLHLAMVALEDNSLILLGCYLCNKSHLSIVENEPWRMCEWDGKAG